jgi:two-component system CheB/CheR fusion protein
MASPIDPILPGPSDSSEASPTRLRIVVVDDNADAAESIRLLLELAGHEVVSSCDAADGLEKIRSIHPQVVLCDIGLPGAMDGHAVARTLRGEAGFESTRLIALTAYGRPEDRERSRLAGFDLHLTKPVTFDDLLIAIVPPTPREDLPNAR